MTLRATFHARAFGRRRIAPWSDTEHVIVALATVHGRFRLVRYHSSETNSKKDYLRSDGVVEGVWVFTRHGDRLPSRCLSPDHRRKEEAAFWMSRLPCPDSAAAFESFSKRFPLHIQKTFNQGKFNDVVRNPFGFLTQSGLEHLNQNGKMLFERYSQHGHHLPDKEEWRRGVAEDFLSAWNLSVFSTNYLRTVMSVQSLLDGLLGTNLMLPTCPRSVDPQVSRELRVPNHTWRRPHNTDPLVKVTVRDVRHDPLNAFDRNPDLIAELVNEVMQSESFFKGDGNAAPLAARLANILPGLAPRTRQADFSSRSPSGINWIEAADHFICRAAHKVPFSRFTDFEHDERIEQTLESLAHQTVTHLAWRFRQWYQNKRLLAVIAAPPLREVADQMLVATGLGARERRPFVIYSCHDITLLGLLYGLGADFLADEEKSKWRFWPTYGSHIIFELVRIEPQNNESHAGSTYVVRVMLNGNPVITADAAKTATGRTTLVYTGKGPDNMLYVEDFIKLVSRVETQGGYDYDSLLGR